MNKTLTICSLSLLFFLSGINLGAQGPEGLPTDNIDRDPYREDEKVHFSVKLASLFQLGFVTDKLDLGYFRIASRMALRVARYEIVTELWLQSTLGNNRSITLKFKDAYFLAKYFREQMEFRLGVGYDNSNWGYYYKPLYAGEPNFGSPLIPYSGFSLAIAPKIIPLTFVIGGDIAMSTTQLVWEDVFATMALSLGRRTKGLVFEGQLEYWLAGDLSRKESLENIYLLGLKLRIFTRLNILEEIVTFVTSESDDFTGDFAAQGQSTLGLDLKDIWFVDRIRAEFNFPYANGVSGYYIDTNLKFKFPYLTLYLKGDFDKNTLIDWGFRSGISLKFD